MEKQYQVNIKCIFCGSTQFEYDENNPPKDGEMIKCGNCGKLNDFSAIRDLAITNKREEIKAEFHKEIEDKLKKMLKKFNKK